MVTFTNSPNNIPLGSFNVVVNINFYCFLLALKKTTQLTIMVSDGIGAQ
jgi:hypothetical protein